MTNKYQESLEHINMKMYSGYCSKCDVNTEAKGNEIILEGLIKEKCSKCPLKNDFDALQVLINKWTELGCELSNLPFLDDECKLKTIKQIERIYYGK